MTQLPGESMTAWLDFYIESAEDNPAFWNALAAKSDSTDSEEEYGPFGEDLED